MNADAIAGSDACRPKRASKTLTQRVELTIGEDLTGAVHREVVGLGPRPLSECLVEARHGSPIILAIIARWISELPEKIREGTASRSSASMPVSGAMPEAPKIWIASSPV